MLKVNKNILQLISGILWTGIGILLPSFTIKWFPLLNEKEKLIVLIIGIILGITIAYFGFSKIANKNINRINQYNKKISVFKFQTWKSYILIIFMINLGVFMRTSGKVPKNILVPIYLGIGIALFISSFKYYIFLLKYLKNRNLNQ